MRNVLTGWTRTGGRGSRGRVVAPLPGGDIDWARPRCEPDNGLRAVLGRLAPFIAFQVIGLPTATALLWVSNLPGYRAGYISVAEAMPGPFILGSLQLVALAVGFAALLTWRFKVWLERRDLATVEVRVAVTASPLDPGIPCGQLVYRRFDSPALTEPARAALPAGEVA